MYTVNYLFVLIIDVSKAPGEGNNDNIFISTLVLIYSVDFNRMVCHTVMDKSDLVSVRGYNSYIFWINASLKNQTVYKNYFYFSKNIQT